MDAARISPNAVRAALRRRAPRKRRRDESPAAAAARVRVLATGSTSPITSPASTEQ
jgi:hypothetical protein